MFPWLGMCTGGGKSSPGIQKISISSQNMFSLRLQKHTLVHSIQFSCGASCNREHGYWILHGFKHRWHKFLIDKSARDCWVELPHPAQEGSESPVSVFKHVETIQRMYHPMFGLYKSFPQRLLLTAVRDRIPRQTEHCLMHYSYSYVFISPVTKELHFWGALQHPLVVPQWSI